MYPSIFNRFPVIQPVSSKVRHFSTFLAHFSLPVYAPGIIAVIVTWMKKGFNACKTPRCIYPSIFNHFWDIAIYLWQVLVENHDIFIPHLRLAPPHGVTPSEFREDLDKHKTRMNGLSCGEESMTICSAVLIQYQRVTDRRFRGHSMSLEVVPFKSLGAVSYSPSVYYGRICSRLWYF